MRGKGGWASGSVTGDMTCALATVLQPPDTARKCHPSSSCRQTGCLLSTACPNSLDAEAIPF